MQEVVPANTLAPLSEPELRVGIVISEDQKTELNFIPECDFYEQRTGKILPAKQKYQIRIKANKIEIQSDSLQINSDKFILQSNTELAQRVINFDKIVAGRFFHWKKEISEKIAGNFELHIKDHKLILVNIIPFQFLV